MLTKNIFPVSVPEKRALKISHRQDPSRLHVGENRSVPVVAENGRPGIFQTFHRFCGGMSVIIRPYLNHGCIRRSSREKRTACRIAASVMRGFQNIRFQPAAAKRDEFLLIVRIDISRKQHAPAPVLRFYDEAQFIFIFTVLQNPAVFLRSGPGGSQNIQRHIS